MNVFPSYIYIYIYIQYTGAVKGSLLEKHRNAFSPWHCVWWVGSRFDPCAYAQKFVKQMNDLGTVHHGCNATRGSIGILNIYIYIYTYMYVDMHIYIYGGVYFVSVNYTPLRPCTSDRLGAHEGLAH